LGPGEGWLASGIAQWSLDRVSEVRPSQSPHPSPPLFGGTPDPRGGFVLRTNQIAAMVASAKAPSEIQTHGKAVDVFGEVRPGGGEDPLKGVVPVTWRVATERANPPELSVTSPVIV